jgi:zinc protease
MLFQREKVSFMTQAIRKTAPEALAPVPFSIPPVYQTTLDNGFRIVVLADKRLPLISYRLAFLSGDAADPRDSIGLTSAMTAMLTEGTENYSSRELAETIERLGAGISANASDDFTIIAASTLSMYSSDVLRLIAEVVFRPTFPESELDLYRRNTIESLKFQRSQPNFLANEQTARLLYGDHPYSVISPSPDDISKLTRAELQAHREKMFVPNNAVLVAVGDVETDAFVSEIRSYFGHWVRGSVEPISPAAPPPREATAFTIVDRPGSAQANIVMSNLAFERNHPDFFAATVMNQVLGAGASSRVFMNLREEKGYTYGAYTRIDSKKLAGDFEATAEVRTAVTGDSLREFFFELNRIRDENVPEAELDDAKNFLTGVFPIRAETQEGLTNLIVNQQLYGLPDDYLQTYRDNINAVTVEDIARVANKYVRPESMAIVIVGDAADIIPQVRAYSQDIEVFDTEGGQKDLASYDAATTETANIAGSWQLMLDFQGQQVPVSLELRQSGDELQGKLETVLGIGEISNGTVKGKRFSAVAVTEIQGQSVDLTISGSADGDALAGTIEASLLPEALAFTGTREA